MIAMSGTGERGEQCNGVLLAWLIDIQRRQIWVWEKQELPLIYAGNDQLPTLDNISDFTVETIIALTQQQA
ncbi:MAG: hypothetical protein ACKO86_08545 [Dolichospermum sp.]